MDYFTKLQALLRLIAEREAESMERAAQAVADAIAADGLIHFFGCGHSHLLCEEVFFRAGGLACVHPILDSGLMLHEGAVRSSDLERMAGYGSLLVRRHRILPHEVLVVISTSGRNPVPVEVAQYGREQGATVIALTSIAYSQSQPSRHASGMRLCDAGDIVIDNHIPPGDALLSVEGFGVPFGPASTAIGAATIQQVLARAVALLVERGVEPPVFRSGNLDGADAHNMALVARYRGRVPALR